MYATVGFTGDDLPVRIGVSPRHGDPHGSLLHIHIEGDNVNLLLDEATARRLRDALAAVLPANGGVDERGYDPESTS